MDQNDRQLSSQLIKHSLENHTGFFVDWKATAEDVIYNVKQVLPDLDIQALGEKQVDGQWMESSLIGGRQYDFFPDSPDFIDAIMRKINSLLTDKLFITPQVRDDNLTFILVDQTSLPDLLKIGFTKP